jgi:tetratricopeptide (TPR) repeat protein
LAFDEASLGADHPEVSVRLSNLAQLLQDTNRLAEAEQLMRHALAIDEATLGADHSAIAIDLNNLASLLYATNRLAEAEPLMRRHLVIFLAFQRDTGHPHPHRDVAIENYRILLEELSHGDAAIEASIRDLHREADLT